MLYVTDHLVYQSIINSYFYTKKQRQETKTNQLSKQTNKQTPQQTNKNPLQSLRWNLENALYYQNPFGHVQTQQGIRGWE